MKVEKIRLFIESMCERFYVDEDMEEMEKESEEELQMIEACEKMIEKLKSNQ